MAGTHSEESLSEVVALAPSSMLHSTPNMGLLECTWGQQQASAV